MNAAMSEATKTFSPAQAAAESKPAARRREEAIRKSVLAALGTPDDLVRVAVVRLWGDNFRVNVWTDGGAGAGIPHSYFVTADAGGTVLDSVPPVRKLD